MLDEYIIRKRTGDNQNGWIFLYSILLTVLSVTKKRSAVSVIEIIEKVESKFSFFNWCYIILMFDLIK